MTVLDEGIQATEPQPVTRAFKIDRRALAQSFSRAAPNYEAAAHLQRRVRARLLDELPDSMLRPSIILDLGAGTGKGTQQLQRRYPHAQVLAIDIAFGMLRTIPHATLGRTCADAHALPIARCSVDLIYSSLMLQWCDEPEAVFREFARVLRPGGRIYLSTFGPQTLRELRAAWAVADVDSHVSVFPGKMELEMSLRRACFIELKTTCELHPLYYPNARALMQELKQIGARNAARSRSRGLTGRARLQRMLEAYERARSSHGLPATYEIIYVVARTGNPAP